MDSAKRVISGTWGEVWLDNAKVGECYGLQLKVAFKKEDVPICGEMAVDKKNVSVSGTGSMKLHKVYSRMPSSIGDQIMQGHDVRFTIVSKLADPDSYGAERVAVHNVSFDDLTLADWEAAVMGKVEAPFTFTKYDYLDRIEVR